MIQYEETSNEVPQSVARIAAKARGERIQRLMTALERRIDNPLAIIDALMTELAAGDYQRHLWERFHAAAMRDELEGAVAAAYLKCASGPRMKRLAPEAQATVLMHAADYLEETTGDPAAAQELLERTLRTAPGHTTAFTRLERDLEKRRDARGLLVLYGSVAAATPRPVQVLANQVHHRLLQVAGNVSLPNDTCIQLVALAPHNPAILDALERHCRATKRPDLACELIERTLTCEGDESALTARRRYRLLELYVGEVDAPAKAIVHAEKLLEHDPADPVALRAADRMLGRSEVASRAAVVLQNARKLRQSG